MKKPARPTKRPSTVKRPLKKSAAQRDQDRRLTDEYAEAGRKNALRRGGELAELEPVGKKRRG